MEEPSASGPRALMRRHRALLLAALAVFALALAIRMGHLASLRHGLEGTRIFSTGRVDAAHHLREAGEILDGDFWLRERVPWKGPGYSYFLAAWTALLGRDPAPLRWVMALLGALNCAGLVLLARKFLSLRGAVVAGALAAANGIVVLFDGELYFPTLLISLNLCAFLLLLRKKRGPGSAAGAGAAIGLAALVHPPYLLIGGAMLAWLARRRWKQALLFALAAGAMIAPVTAKNLWLHDQPVLISWSGGINFYLGNQPGYDQTSGQGTPAWDRILQTPLDAGIEGEADRDRLYYGRALQQVAAEPWTAAAILAHKLRIFFSPVEIGNNFRIYELREYSLPLRLLLGRSGPFWWPFGLWAPLALIGSYLLYRRRIRGQDLLLLWTLLLILSCVLFFSTARYRVPAVFFGTIWAAAALEAGWRALAARQRGRLAAGVAAAAVLFAIVAALPVPQRSLPPPLEHTEALVRESLGQLRESGIVYQLACDRDPDDVGLLLSAAAFHGRHGDQPRSRDYLIRALSVEELEPDDRSNTYEALADSFLVEGRLEEAERAFGQALRVGVDEAEWRGAPYFQLGLGPVSACRLRLGLAELERRRGDPARARSIVAEVVSECGAHGRIADRLGQLDRKGIR